MGVCMYVFKHACMHVYVLLHHTSSKQQRSLCRTWAPQTREPAQNVVSVFVCMYVCMYVYMGVCIYVFKHARICIIVAYIQQITTMIVKNLGAENKGACSNCNTYVYMYVCMYVYMGVHTYVFERVDTVCMHVCMYVCMYVYYCIIYPVHNNAYTQTTSR